MDNHSKSDSQATLSSNASSRIIKRFGGRHLIFRTKSDGWRMVPQPYVLVSSFRGPIWMFYGAGQIWLTHKKWHEIGGWMARVPRVANKQVTDIVDRLESDLEMFINHCNEHGIEGTLVIERKMIEFHWTFGDELEQEKAKQEHSESVDTSFQQLCDRFLDVKSSLGLE